MKIDVLRFISDKETTISRILLDGYLFALGLKTPIGIKKSNMKREFLQENIKLSYASKVHTMKNIKYGLKICIVECCIFKMSLTSNIY